MAKITAPHMNTAICCILGSVMRGTFSASAIVANERVPSRASQSTYKQDQWLSGHTHGSDNLGLQPELVGKATGEVAHATFAVSSNIRYFSDMVEHVAAGEHQYGDETYGSPEVSVLYDRNNIRRSDAEERDERQDSGGDRDQTCIVDRSVDGGFGSFRQMSNDPVIHLLRRLWPR